MDSTIVNATINKLSEVVAGLAETLAVPAEQVWDILVWQAQLTGIMGIVQVILLGIATYAYCKTCQWLKKNGKYEPSTPDWDWAYEFAALASGIFLCIGWIASWARLVGIVARIANPEYYAIKTLLSAL